MDMVRSYFYYKIEDGLNSVRITDVESMTEDEIETYKYSMSERLGRTLPPQIIQQ